MRGFAPGLAGTVCDINVINTLSVCKKNISYTIILPGESSNCLKMNIADTK